MSNRVLAWHFLAEDRHTRFEPRVLVQPGQKLTVEPPLAMCRRGLHASIRAIDALTYAPGPVVCYVELSGEMLRDADKVCASERTCLWMADATASLHEFSCLCAERSLEFLRSSGISIDPRSADAIECKRRWLRGEATDEEMAAARDVALDVAIAEVNSAAWAAACAASKAVSRKESWVLARDVAWSAIWSESRFGSLTEVAALLRNAQNHELEEMLFTLEPKEKPQ